MQYFLFTRVIGLCAKLALKSHDLSDDRPCVIHFNGRVIDANSAAHENHVPIGIPLQEAKVILQDRGVFVEYRPEDFVAARDSLLVPALKYSDRIQSGIAGEGFIDLSGHPQPVEIAAIFLREIHRDIKLPIFAGMASSLWLACISAQICDPVMMSLGLIPFEPVLDPAEWLGGKSVNFLTPLGEQDRTKLHQLGFDRISQVQKSPLVRLEQQFPKRGLMIQQAAFGKLADPIQPNYPGKMIAREILLAGSENSLEIDHAFAQLACDVAEHLSSTDQQSGSIHLTIHFENGERRSHVRKLAKPIFSASQLKIAFQQSLLVIKPELAIDRIRVQLLDLNQSTRRQTRLVLEGQDREAQSHVANTMNRLEASLGTGAVMIASEISTPYNIQVLREWKRATGWR
ncbi:MAG: hypothetical protein ACKVQS_09380 [Fimbriimonadaceae bacterium]